ncbi:caspase family protein [Sinorhizobium meliloti]|uniref:caspase family protein n=1 Tax=Rhizobium meliloti TaxID=382 RepID=UPI00244E3A72|nr:caspase family protein [Sinorhizobium meliloti]WGI73341.1 caspase family protein [Sinorhizobium meliloti]
MANFSVTPGDWDLMFGRAEVIGPAYQITISFGKRSKQVARHGYATMQGSPGNAWATAAKEKASPILPPVERVSPTPESRPSRLQLPRETACRITPERAHRSRVAVELKEGSVRRVALIIGIDRYTHHRLKNAVSDARKIDGTLKQRGFVTIRLEDPDEPTIKTSFSAFQASAAKADIALIYLAGHGVERSGSGYFLPQDFPFPVTALATKLYGISVGDAVEAVRGAYSGIVILDACRNWPISQDEERALSEQLDAIVANQREWNNVLLAYSTSSADTAGDGIPGTGSRFCHAFTRHALDHSLTMDECFRRISQDVLSESLRGQQPWTYSSLQRSLTFTDLPRFFLQQRHAAQNVGSWATADYTATGIFAGADNESVWLVTPATAVRECLMNKARIVGAAHLGRYLLLASQDGKVWSWGDTGSALIFDTSSRCNGMATSPKATRFATYGASKVSFFKVADGGLKSVFEEDMKFEIYCCKFVTEDIVWVGGEDGNILSFDLRPEQPTVVAFEPLGYHINAMALSHDQSSVYCAGQTGRVAALNLSGNLLRTIFADLKPKTAWGLRATLSMVAGDDLIHRYLFDRRSLPEQTICKLEQHIAPVDFHSCAHAPGLPIVAVGSTEGMIHILDSRDGQILQEIEATTSSICGLVFLSDHQLAALCTDGEAMFFAAKLS